ncbi:hypothetical protein G3480_11955 [Thiorhodococcus mannitoliphagus]|uniref:Uncharacterized protein n=1 Tax=Thiorhodococcus mannitoliphagus TaxID=329406 RepID=A0A6P1DRW9_9GAMM|nr:hypothetical protein [Thiorhodococcus mannitoliphagus]NEX21017.1 hypothetical protein [Thiorhodococcus mannitoliphagus]
MPQHQSVSPASIPTPAAKPAVGRLRPGPSQGLTRSLGRALGVVVLCFAIWILQGLPFARLPLLFGATVYLGVLLWRPALWLIFLPLLLPVLDLRPWTGRIYVDEFDACVLITLAAYLLRGRYTPSLGAIPPFSRLLLALFIGLVLISLFRTLHPWPSVDANSFFSYYSPFNALRVSKGLLWALLLYPAWVAEDRSDAACARRYLFLGMSFAGLAVLAVVLWERGFYSTLFFWSNIYAPISSLLDFTTPYRVTALFADMHTGGTAIDGWLLLTLPFTAAAFLTARGPIVASLSGIAVLGVLYTAFVTFSRGVYLGVFVAIAVAALMLILRRRPRTNSDGMSLLLLAAFTMVGTAYVAFRSGGAVVLAYSLGAFLSGALVTMVPSPVARGRWRPVVMTILMLTLTLLATWTIFDRNYGFLPLTPLLQAAICIPPAVIAGFWTGKRMAGRLPLHQSGAILAVFAGFVFLLTLSLFGYRMDTRLADASMDLQTRIAHWQTAVSIMDRGLSTRLLGQGVGRFPQTYYLMHEDPASVAGFRLEGEGSNHSLRLLGGNNIRIGQRLSLVPQQTYQLAFAVRTDEQSKPIQLEMRICHRHLVPAQEWNPSCQTFNQSIQSTDGRWTTVDQNFEAQGLGSFKGGLEGWLTLELANRSAGRWIDIDAISIIDQSGRERVDNGDFEQGFDRWFMYSDFDHLPWHIKNLWVHVYFELGLTGLFLFGLLALTALTTTARSAAIDPLVFALLAALAGFYAVGAFGTIIDSPRLSLLFWLITLLALGSASARRARDPSRTQLPHDALPLGQASRRLAHPYPRDEQSPSVFQTEQSSTALRKRPSTTSPLSQRGARGDFGRHRSHRETTDGHFLNTNTQGRRWRFTLNHRKQSLMIVMVVLVLSSAAAVVALQQTMRFYDVDGRQLVTKVLERYEIELPWLEPWLRAPPRLVDVALDGRQRSTHPRILLPELADWDGHGLAPAIRSRRDQYVAVGIDARPYPPCGGSGALRLAVCWILTGDEASGRRGLEALNTFQPSLPNAGGDYSDGWELAWAYDWLALHPEMPASTRSRVQARLLDLLPRYLELLDGRGPSLWHGRVSLASTAWLIAIAIDPENPEQQELIRRSQAHFREAIAALRLTEGWPEGYNYWINSRAFILTLAAAAYLNGFEETQYAPEIRKALERVGLWTLYMTRPDGRVELTGDEGPRVDLKDETRRVIDLIVQLTRSRVLSSYSRWLEARHGTESYYRDYRWGFQLFNDPTVWPLASVTSGTLDGLKTVLPSADWFGPKAFNQIVARSGWGADDTLLTLRAGHSLTHHGHYDAGHFTLLKGAPLAISNATYRGDIAAPNRLYYGIRTVSRNSLLVLRPNERIHPSPLVERNVIDGGQRIVMPTGSSVQGVADWLAQIGQGRHYEGGVIRTYQLIDDRLLYVEADLTGAYDNSDYDSQDRGGKVAQVTRALLYLLDEDRVFVFDTVESTDPGYTKKWLLHLPQRPDIPDLRVKLGNENAGILESPSARLSMVNGRGKLDLVRLAPKEAVTRLVGGKGYEYYVEADGDDQVLDGINFGQDSLKARWFDNGLWRIEIQPTQPNRLDRFLIALTPSLRGANPKPVEPLRLNSGEALAAYTDNSLLLFDIGHFMEPVRLAIPGQQTRLLVTGVSIGDQFEVDLGDRQETVSVTQSGLIELSLDAQAKQISIRQRP